MRGAALMDLMKTLLIYMTATVAMSVQNTDAPKETPVPVPAETAIVETVEGTPAPGGEDVPGAVLTAVPPEMLGQVDQANPGDMPTPAPVPTITPNAKGYHNLGMGSKGKEVKKLQEKLIELKYLPEGSADGAYGRKTYNAVKKFQYYNGLKQDGVAGRATQTNLFENPDIVPNPEAAAEPEATATPAPAEEPAEGAEKGAAGTEAPAETEAPEATEAPAETEKPAETEPPAVTEKPETTEAPAETEAPAGTEAPEKAEDGKEQAEIVENVDLDADVYEPVDGAVALNEANGPLEFIRQEDGVPVNARPRLEKSGTKIRVSLDDLCECTGWRLTDDGAGAVVLEAAGYALALYNEDSGISATLDGTEIPMKQDDFDFTREGHFINARFLATALKGETEWDEDEDTLILRIRDKDAVESAD